ALVAPEHHALGQRVRHDQQPLQGHFPNLDRPADRNRLLAFPGDLDLGPFLLARRDLAGGAPAQPFEKFGFLVRRETQKHHDTVAEHHGKALPADTHGERRARQDLALEARRVDTVADLQGVDAGLFGGLVALPVDHGIDLTDDTRFFDDGVRRVIGAPSMIRPPKALGFPHAFAFDPRLRYFCVNPFTHVDRISTKFGPDDPAMTNSSGSDAFYGSIPVFRGFTRLMEPQLYSPLPDDWTIGVADIVESTKAIAAQRYKAVNMAGAAVIAAVTNALQGREFPFVFGGDGASFAVAPEDLSAARGAGGDRDLGEG